MINENDIVFVTTTLYSKWLDYQSNIIKKLFPNSQHIIVDGRTNWPNCWFYWIDDVKGATAKYYIHIDEDFFITSKSELMGVLDKMETHGIDIMGCSDGYNHYRSKNPVAINTFFMIGRVSDIKRLDIDLKSFTYKDNYNSHGIKYKLEYGVGFNYPYEKLGDVNLEIETEPFYAFLWSMKELGCKFDYLYPHFDARFKSINPRLSEDSIDIGIHMWYTRMWESEMDVFGIRNVDRYTAVELYLNSL
jgi:hypothetical protein